MFSAGQLLDVASRSAVRRIYTSTLACILARLFHKVATIKCTAELALSAECRGLLRIDEAQKFEKIFGL
jgi:hypothetical protein